MTNSTLSFVWRAGAVGLLSVVAIMVAIFYPYGQEWWAVLALGVWLANLCVFGWLFFNWRGPNVLKMCLLPLLIVPYYVLTTRHHVDFLVEAQFSGTIVRRYRSDNHQYPAVEIEDGGKSILVEPLPEETWESLHVGASVDKERLATYLTCGDKRLAVVEPSALHKLRGALVE